MSGAKIVKLNSDQPFALNTGAGSIGQPVTGDVNGTLPGTTVVGIDGFPITGSPPSAGDILTFNGTSWVEGPPAAAGISVTDGTTTVSSVTTETVPAGGVTSLGAGNAGLNFLTNARGGQGIVKPHGNFGATETIDLVDGNWHWGTLNADCTFTFSAVASTKDCEFWLEMIEDGTGGWTPTFPGSVVFPGGTPVHDTTLGTTTIYGFLSRDGGTTWIGGVFGGGGTGTAITVYDEGSPLTTALASLNFAGNGVTATTSGDDVTVTIPGGATALDTGIWRPLLDAATGAIIVNGTTGEATMGFGPA